MFCQCVCQKHCIFRTLSDNLLGSHACTKQVAFGFLRLTKENGKAEATAPSVLNQMQRFDSSLALARKRDEVFGPDKVACKLRVFSPRTRRQQKAVCLSHIHCSFCSPSVKQARKKMQIRASAGFRGNRYLATRFAEASASIRALSQFWHPKTKLLHDRQSYAKWNQRLKTHLPVTHFQALSFLLSTG